MLLEMWPLLLPVACVPLWQETQFPVTPAWSKRVTGLQAATLWQFSHVLSVAIWPMLLPVACVPLWQEMQLALMPAWLNVAGFQADVR